MAVSENVVSGVMRIKQKDGSYLPLFPTTSSYDVLYDQDKKITMNDILHRIVNYVELASKEAMFNQFGANPSKVALGTIIIAGGVKYRVIDLNNLNNDNGYEVINSFSKSINILNYTSDSI